MAEYVEDREPVVVREREVVRDDSRDDRQPVQKRHRATPYILLFLLALIILGYLFFRHNPFASGKSTNINVNVPTPTLNNGN